MPKYPWAVRAGGPLLGGGGAELPLFFWSAKDAEPPPDTTAFTRPSVKRTVTVTNSTTQVGGGVGGGWFQDLKSGEVPFWGLRRVENLLDSANGTGPFTDIAKEGRLAVSVVASNGTLTINIGGTPQVFTPTGTPQRFIAFDDAVGGATSVTISGTATLSNPMAHLCQVGNDRPEFYVTHNQEFGNVGAQGVQVSNTNNANTVDGNGVVTFATGTLIPPTFERLVRGYRPNKAAINLVAEPEDLLDASWTETGLTPTDQGITSIGLKTWRLNTGGGTSAHIISTPCTGSGKTNAGFFVRTFTGITPYLTVRIGSDPLDQYFVYEFERGLVTESVGLAITPIVRAVNSDWYEVEMPIENAAIRDLTIGIANQAQPGTSAPVYQGTFFFLEVAIPQVEASIYRSPPLIVNTSDDIFDTGVQGPAEQSCVFDVKFDYMMRNDAGDRSTFFSYNNGSSRLMTTVADANILLFTTNGFSINMATSAFALEQHKYALSMKENDAILVNDEGDVGTDVTGTTIEQNFFLGVANPGLISVAKKIFRSCSFFGSSKTQAQLEALTEKTFSVFLIAGQSNTHFGANILVEDGAPTARENIWQWGRFAPNNAVAIPAFEALENISANALLIGFPYLFSKLYNEDNIQEEIMLIPCGEGSTGFSNNRWNKGDFNYADAVDRANAVMAAYPKSTFKGVLWHQGETDALNAVPQGTYETDLDTMIADMRADITGASSSVFLVGELAPDFIAGDPVPRTPIQTAIQGTPGRISNCALSSSSGLTTYDGTHFNATSQRTLGQRYYDAFLTL